MNEIYSNNMAVIRQRWPDIASQIDNGSSAYVVWGDAMPVVTMEVSGLRLHSGYQPLEEAELQLRDIPVDVPEITIYGIGMGFLPRIALETHEQARLRVVPMNLSVFRASLEVIDHQAWLMDPRCELIDPVNETTISKPFAAVPACLQLIESTQARLRDQILLELNTPFLKRESPVSRARRAQQIEDNRDYLAQDGDVGELFAAQSGRALFVAAAGPTLTTSLDWIREHRAEAQLVAVDAALRPLLDAGIVPDYVVAADAERRNLVKYFRGDLSLCRAVPLIYLPVVHNDVLALWPGPRYAAYTTNPVYERYRQAFPKAALFMSGSVAHIAVDLAIRLGADELTLFGFDFAFPGQAVHANPDVSAEQLKQQANTRTWVLDGYGNRIASAPNLVGYLRDLESYIEQHPDVVWKNASRDGAAIAGVELPGEGVTGE